MRSAGPILVTSLAILCVIATVTAYAYIGWIGVGILGLMIVFVAVQFEMDDAVPSSSTFPTSTIVTTLLHRPTGRAETAERHLARKTRHRVTLVAKITGGLLAAAGCAGFFLLQIPHLT